MLFRSESAWLDRASLVRREGMHTIAESAPSRWFTPEFYGLNPSLVNELLVNLKNTSPEGYASCCEALAHENLSKSISGIKVPTLIIAGMMDPVTTVPDAVAMQNQIQDSELVQLSASHISNVEAEVEFNSCIKQFFSKRVQEATHLVVNE